MNLIEGLQQAEGSRGKVSRSSGRVEMQASGEEGVVRLLTAVDLDRCIVKLPVGARTVYVLHDLEGFTQREIAGLLDLASGTVKAQLHRARGLLRNMLSAKKRITHG